jgi:hypothetical protein
MGFANKEVEKIGRYKMDTQRAECDGTPLLVSKLCFSNIRDNQNCQHAQADVHPMGR